MILRANESESLRAACCLTRVGETLRGLASFSGNLQAVRDQILIVEDAFWLVRRLDQDLGEVAQAIEMAEPEGNLPLAQIAEHALDMFDEAAGQLASGRPIDSTLMRQYAIAHVEVWLDSVSSYRLYRHAENELERSLADAAGLTPADRDFHGWVYGGVWLRPIVSNGTWTKDADMVQAEHRRQAYEEVLISSVHASNREQFIGLLRRASRLHGYVQRGVLAL